MQDTMDQSAINGGANGVNSVSNVNGQVNGSANENGNEKVNATAPTKVQRKGSPGLTVRCGPLLRYLGMNDTQPNTWRGSVMIVTEDAGSDYLEPPVLSVDSHQNVQGSRIHQEQGMSFWRFGLELELAPLEQVHHYSINNGATPEYAFYVPAQDQTMNVMFHSCNGFSTSVDTSQFKGSLWTDVLDHHEKVHYHVMLGGGDQIYMDMVNVEVESVKAWGSERNPLKKRSFPFTDKVQAELSHFYLFHYIKWFGQGYWVGNHGSTHQPDLPRAFAQIPMINIFDDHDIIDGFGSYRDSTMRTPMMSGIGSTVAKYYYLFQHQLSVDELLAMKSKPTEPGLVVSPQIGPYINLPSASIYARLGKGLAFYGLDARTERQAHEVVTPQSYETMFARLKRETAAAPEIKHILLMLGVPLAYPRLVWLETILSSSMLVPVKGIIKHTKLRSMLNSFDGSVEILDDLDDHWCARHHKHERNQLVQRIFDFVKDTNVRVTILSGDVHLAGIGRFYSTNGDLQSPSRDPHLLFNVISSAIVNTPPPDAMANFLNKRNKVHHFSHHVHEDMVRIFASDVDGTTRANDRLLPRRNWGSIVRQGDVGRGDGQAKRPGPVAGIPESAVKESLYISDDDSLSVVLHVEKDQHDASGETVGYELIVPAL